MRIDKTFDSPANEPTRRRRKLSAGPKKGSDDIAKRGLVRRARPEQNVSESEIRQKLAERKQVKTSGKNQAARRTLLNRTKIHSNFMEESAPMSQEEAVQKADEIRRSDVGINDPNDLATHGKLRDVIGKGAFGFSEKERAVLEQILAE